MSLAKRQIKYIFVTLIILCLLFGYYYLRHSVGAQAKSIKSELEQQIVRLESKAIKGSPIRQQIDVDVSCGVAHLVRFYKVNENPENICNKLNDLDKNNTKIICREKSKEKKQDDYSNKSSTPPLQYIVSGFTLVKNEKVFITTNILLPIFKESLMPTWDTVRIQRDDYDAFYNKINRLNSKGEKYYLLGVSLSYMDHSKFKIVKQDYINNCEGVGVFWDDNYIKNERYSYVRVF